MAKLIECPCGSGSGKLLADCCARFIEGREFAPTAEALMRSRYTAYNLMSEVYLLSTWHVSTRPVSLELKKGVSTKWFRLEVKRHEQQDKSHAIVEFVAHYKVNGRAHKMHETSRFVHEDGRWFYLDGEVG